MEKENGNYYSIYRGFTSVYVLGLVENKMETTIMGYARVILGLYRDNGKEHGNYYSGIIYGLGFRVVRREWER